MLCIENALLFDGETFKKNKKIFIRNNKIFDISQKNKQNISQKIDAASHIVCPGFIDIQVNGGGGIFFNEHFSLAEIRKAALTHAHFGTTAILPTFITDKRNKLLQFVSAINAAIKANIPGIIGCHLEGPFLNPIKKGIHAEEYMRLPEVDDFSELKCLERGIKLITLAPEVVTEDYIKELIKQQIIVFAGHTNATLAAMNQAFSLGVSGVTHLFNACSQLGSREPGVVGAFLLNKQAWAGIIADGYHVSYETLKIALKIKGSEKFILVSDAMSPVGTTQSKFKIYDKEIFVNNGKYLDSSGTLAGSSLTMYQAFKNIMQQKLVTLEEALKMTSTNAAECLNLTDERSDFLKGRVLPKFDADLVIINKTNYQLMHVIQQGVVVY